MTSYGLGKLVDEVNRSAHVEDMPHTEAVRREDDSFYVTWYSGPMWLAMSNGDSDPPAIVEDLVVGSIRRDLAKLGFLDWQEEYDGEYKLRAWMYSPSLHVGPVVSLNAAAAWCELWLKVKKQRDGL